MLGSLRGQVIEFWSHNFELDKPPSREWRSGFHAQDSLAFIEQDSGWIYYNPFKHEASFITTRDPLSDSLIRPRWSLWLDNRIWFLANDQIYFYQDGRTYRGDSLWPDQNFQKVDYLFSDDRRLLFFSEPNLWIWDQDSLQSIHVPWDVRQEKRYKAFLGSNGLVYAISKNYVYQLVGKKLGKL